MPTLEIPSCNTSDPADLEAWFGNFGYAGDFRKVVLSNCAELVRAGAAAGDAKISESRVNDLAHTHAIYVDFLIHCLNGRRLREQNVRDSIAQGGMR